MKATELMIGDLIQYNGEILRLYEFSRKYGYFGEGHPLNGILLDEIEPIPLTPEILEKNGFEIYEQDFTSNTVYKFGPLDYMEYEEYHKYFDIGCMIKYTHFGTEATYIHSLMRIKYVHELQNALKLCGINLEIKI